MELTPAIVQALRAAGFRSSDELPRGIAISPKGWRVAVRVVRRRFPLSTPFVVVEDWQRKEKARQELGIREAAREAARERTLEDKVADYLPGCVGMATYEARVRDMRLWCDAEVKHNGRDVRLGDLAPTAISPLMVKAVCGRWRTSGPRAEQYFEINRATGRKVQNYRLVPGPLAANTVNKRKRALENFFTLTYGRAGCNPAREVPDEAEDPGPPKALPIDVLREIVAAVPDAGQGRGPRVRGGRFCQPTDAAAAGCAKEPPSSKTKARVRVLVETDLPPAQLKRMDPAHVHYETSSVWVRRRKKGKGFAAGELPVTLEALEAFRELQTVKGFGPFSNAVIGKAWHRACRVVEQQFAAQGVEVDLSGSSPYSARHSFATDIVATMRDTRLAARLLLHGSAVTTQRYAAAAIDPILADAVQKLAAMRRRRTGGS